MAAPKKYYDVEMTLDKNCKHSKRYGQSEESHLPQSIYLPNDLVEALGNPMVINVRVSKK